MSGNSFQCCTLSSGACDATGLEPPAMSQRENFKVEGRACASGGPECEEQRDEGGDALSLIDADRNFNRRNAYEVSGRHSWRPASGTFFRRRRLGKGIDDLLCRPRCRRMLGHVEMNDPPPVVKKDDEDEEDSTGDGWYGEEIDRAERGDVIREEGSPGLRRWPARPPQNPGNGSLRDLDAQCTQLAMDPRSAPERIRGGDLYHECSNSGMCAGTAGKASR